MRSFSRKLESSEAQYPSNTPIAEAFLDFWFRKTAQFDFQFVSMR